MRRQHRGDKEKMHLEHDSKPADIKTLCLCLRKTTNRQFPTSQRSILTHRKHPWSWNLFKNYCSVVSPEQILPVWAVLLNNAASKTWPALSLPASFPCPSISAARSTTLSQDLEKQKKKVIPTTWAPYTVIQPQGEGRRTCVPDMKGKLRLWQHQFSLV